MLSKRMTESVLDYLAAVDAYSRRQEGRLDNNDEATGSESESQDQQPWPPAEPREVTVLKFEWPDIIAGHLLLKRLALDRGGRASLIRSCGGIMRLGDIERVLRTSEAELFHKGPRQAQASSVGARRPLPPRGPRPALEPALAMTAHDEADHDGGEPEAEAPTPATAMTRIGNQATGRRGDP